MLQKFDYWVCKYLFVFFHSPGYSISDQAREGTKKKKYLFEKMLDILISKADQLILLGKISVFFQNN